MVKTQTPLGEGARTPEIPSSPAPYDEVLRLFYDAGVALFGHGGESEDVQAIMRNGLWVAVPSIKFTTNLLMNPAKDPSNAFNDYNHQKAEIDKLLQDWPGNRVNSDFRKIILVGVKTSGSKDSSKWDLVLPESSESQAKFGQQYNYVVPPSLIPGYIDLDDRLFYSNTFHTFDSSSVTDLPGDSARWTVPPPAE